MLARANFEPYGAARFVLKHPNAFEKLGRMPYRLLHRGLVAAARAETWLRWPLRTLNLQDWLRDSFETVDPGGGRFGLTEPVRKAYQDYRLYLDTPDLAVLLLNLKSKRFWRSAISVENEGVLTRVQQEQPGAIVVGFRIGAYPVLPIALAGRGLDVSMIVGGEPLAELGQRLGETYAPRLARRIQYIDSLDHGVLATARNDLDSGRVVCTLLEMSPIKYAKATNVRFLGWDVDVPYGIPYLSAVTGRSIIPIVITREGGPHFRMQYLDPIPAPRQDRDSIFSTTQALWTALERQVLRYPDQWIGWTRLSSHLGIDLSAPRNEPVLVRS
jgi:hypothetical protein